MFALVYIVNVGGVGVQHVGGRASGATGTGVAAFVHHGRLSEGCGDGNRSARVGELGVPLSTAESEPERQRKPQDEAEDDAE